MVLFNIRQKEMMVNRLNGMVRLIVGLIFLLQFGACTKSEMGGTTAPDRVGDGDVGVKINLQADVFSEQNIQPSDKKATISRYEDVDATQETVVPLGNGISVIATLTAETAAGTNDGRLRSQKTGEGYMAALTRDTSVLSPGVRYRIIVYASNGDYVAHRDFTYGTSTGSSSDFMLFGDVTYTFVGYSINSTSSLPSIKNASNATNIATNLNQAVIDVAASESDYLMYFKKEHKVSGVGTNYINAVLTHKFSQITTTITLNNSVHGLVKNITAPRISTTTEGVKMKLNDGALTYGSLIPTGKPVVFPVVPVVGQRSVTSQPTAIIAPATSTAKLNLTSLILATGVAGGPFYDITGVNVEIPNLHITPGHRYHLVLRFDAPCLTVAGVENDFDWNYADDQIYDRGDFIENSVELPVADFGYVFDIHQMDNSFNMEINGQKISNEEIQFETSSVNGAGSIVRNVHFVDGAEHGLNGIPQIYNISKHTDLHEDRDHFFIPGRPILRVVISPEGNISLFGSKVRPTQDGWGLYPMKLKSGTFNTVQWKKSVILGQNPTNIVKFTQVHWGITNVNAIGRGLQTVICTTNGSN